MLTTLKFSNVTNIFLTDNVHTLDYISKSLKDETACEMFVVPSGISRGVFVFFFRINLATQ